VRRASSCRRWAVAVYRYRPATIWRGNSRLLIQLMEGILQLDVQERSPLIGEVSARGMMNELFRGGQQGAEAEKLSLVMRPPSRGRRW
jgi:hypothetical protein